MLTGVKHLFNYRHVWRIDPLFLRMTDTQSKGGIKSPPLLRVFSISGDLIKMNRLLPMAQQTGP